VDSSCVQQAPTAAAAADDAAVLLLMVALLSPCATHLNDELNRKQPPTACVYLLPRITDFRRFKVQVS